MTDETSECLKRILVVDDDRVFRLRLVQAFQDRGISAVGVVNSSDAISAVETGISSSCRYTHASIDLKIPGQCGLALVSEIKKMAPELKVIVLTGYGSIATAIEAIRLGASNYLNKPVGVEQILLAFNSPRASIPSSTARPFRTPTLPELEHEHIERVMIECEGNVTVAAKVLGLHRRSLQRKLLKPLRRTVV